MPSPQAMMESAQTLTNEQLNTLSELRHVDRDVLRHREEEHRISPNQSEQEFVARKGQSERIPITDDSQLAPKNRTKFMTGFNAGQAVEGGFRRPDRDLFTRTVDFQVGYVYGVIERRNGNIHDDLSCTNRLNFCWELYLADALPAKNTKLP